MLIEGENVSMSMSTEYIVCLDLFSSMNAAEQVVHVIMCFSQKSAKGGDCRCCKIGNIDWQGFLSKLYVMSRLMS